MKICGTWRVGDQLLLMSDAIAQWFLMEVETQREPSLIVRRLLDLQDTPACQEAEIDGLRATHHLRNDDVALVFIEV